MKILLIVLTVIGAALADTSKWTDFHVKYSPLSTGVGVNSFWTIHKRLVDALIDGYVALDVENSLGNRIITLCYKTDHRVCPLYDSQGTIAGMMLAVPPADVEGHGIPYDLNDHPVFEKKTIENVVYWTSTYYLVDPKVIVAGGRPNDVELIGEGLWLKSGSGFTQVPTDLKSIQDNTPYTWQNCIPNMGIHYYYNMTQNLRCEDFEPYFLLVKDDNIVGLGWQFNGRTTPVLRNYYDAIDGNAVRTTVPLGPTCLSAGADTYGVISIHMYFVEKPWAIPCKQSTDSVVPIPGLP